MSAPEAKHLFMDTSHKNKTLATLLAFLFGGAGVHRFYLFGGKDLFAWLHFITVPLSIYAVTFGGDTSVALLGFPFILSTLIGQIAALVLGLTPDDKWDARFNTQSGTSSKSGKPLAVLLVVTAFVFFTGVVAMIARVTDLYLTGGTYG